MVKAFWDDGNYDCMFDEDGWLCFYGWDEENGNI